MKHYFLLFFYLFGFISFSQTTKLIHGKVSFLETSQANVDVINYTTKRLTQTNDLGEFMIEAKIGDALIFMSDKFADQKYILTADDFKKETISIKLAEKPVPLEEVEITRVKAIKLRGATYNDLKLAKVEKDAGRPKVQGVYTGEIENGIDFVQVGKWIGKLFKSKNPKNKDAAVTMDFKEYAAANFNPSFFSGTLKLQPDDTARFLEFCQADPNSKTVIESNDQLAVLEFLLDKKEEFDKLK